jgi:hypothetical protein
MKRFDLDTKNGKEIILSSRHVAFFLLARLDKTGNIFSAGAGQG